MPTLILLLMGLSLLASSDSSSTKPLVRLVNLVGKGNHFVPYQKAWDIQNEVANFHIDLQEHDYSSKRKPIGTLVMLQHPSVYTLGTATQADSGPFGNTAIDGTPLGAYETIKIDRAGQATYHGPGQIVLYPILDLVQHRCKIVLLFFPHQTLFSFPFSLI